MSKSTRFKRQAMVLALCVLQCAVHGFDDLGWRIYMEDAHIATNLSDCKNYIFGIFDGHGGIYHIKIGG